MSKVGAEPVDTRVTDYRDLFSPSFSRPIHALINALINAHKGKGVHIMLMKLSSLPANLAGRIKDQMGNTPDDGPIVINAGEDATPAKRQVASDAPRLSKFCRIRLFWGMIDIEWRIGG